MKPITLLTVLSIGVFILGLTAGSQAQKAPQALLKADIPFDFIVGGMHLPAGQYTLLHLSGPNNIMLRNAEGHAEAVVGVTVTDAELGKGEAKLIFTKYGDKVFLSQVWTEFDNQIHQCLKCREELTLQSQKATPETMTIETHQ